MTPEFRLHEMGWHDFQQLCQTVLRDVLGQTVSTFLDSKDGGRDGAFSGTWTVVQAEDLSGQFVFQCKHTALDGSTLSLSDISDELHKARRLVTSGRCDSYILITNARLTGESELNIVSALKECGVKHVRIFGATWINQTIVESARLRRLVPRLYGLGDLTQILDERAHLQARAVLDAMRTDLAKLVRTGTYEKAAEALETHGFTLLVGAPATGKTTIAAQLALGAADEFDNMIVKLDSMADLQDRWNPNEKQLFWLDDAFGATQFDRSLTQVWNTALPRIAGALETGTRFVLTSRDYIFQSAKGSLKPGAFPRLQEAEVVVLVSDLTLDERRQILYNHLRLGRQPNNFLEQLQPNLDFAAQHAGFTPELARRLGDPFFTSKLMPRFEESLGRFFAEPNEFLQDVIAGLDADSRAALGLIFINRSWLPSPISPSSRDTDLLERLSSDLGGVTSALDSMRGSLVQHLVRDKVPGWVFAHPTMADAYARLLQTPELLHHFIVGFSRAALFTTITCGDIGVRGAVIVSPNLYDDVLDRLDEPVDWSDRHLRRVVSFLSARCDKEFLRRWIQRDPSRLLAFKEPGLMLQADEDNEVAARLNALDLFPEELRQPFAKQLVNYCLEGIDPSVLFDTKLGSILTEGERNELLRIIREEVLGADSEYAWEVESHWADDSPRSDPWQFIDPFLTMMKSIRSDHFPNDPVVAERTAKMEEHLAQWAGETEDEAKEQRSPTNKHSGDERVGQGSSASSRSVFDDLVEGR